ncbi:MAG: bifunctional 4-hydroxy-2-oxoglutarate aldolase/2-dehydro-3-deoxy-phosphogluconate aldolase [Candidatus Omnitrophica bacterium]|nr:bifunctional 4-hydroxy-2-oxoglutarate aldolase/2-dehydro-3-deoxy-phosphogluconate aldolase [Candidatus Omnitrophota bacterium]
MNKKKEEHLKAILESGVIAVVRVRDAAAAINIAKAVEKGGIKVIEITMTVPNALRVIKEVAEELGDQVIIGAGTVLDGKTAKATISAGAEFVVGPTLNLELIEVCKRYNKIAIPGAFTPTEIFSAWQKGADIVKVFPATVAGPKYFKDLRGPLPQIRLLPTGGVNLQNAEDFIKAGAVAIAVGGALVDKKAIAEERYELITQIAKKFIEVIKKARGEENV